MLFNSLDFAIFLPVVFLLYWFVASKSLKYQNALIVFASYVFYGWWDYRFLSLILFSTIIDYSIGRTLKFTKNSKQRKVLLWASIIVNLGFLGFFKYYNFFLDNFIEAFSFFGYQIGASSLNIILPVGISFYTFQTLSYTIDVYKKKLEPSDDFIAFAAFVTFFPQLVAGPIERATNLLPQFQKRRIFEYASAVDGLRQMLWGFLKKVVIADNCAPVVDSVFINYESATAGMLILGATAFAFQIYGDFSGYSDIAIGLSKLFDINLMANFAFPYFSRDIGEFWRRWHISLSTWFRDYLYIPLGGSRGGNFQKINNTFIIFLVSGFWHGSNWTFIAWGAINAVYFLPLLLTKTNRKNTSMIAAGRVFPTIKTGFSILFTFGLVCFSWIFFRADSVGMAVEYIRNIFTLSNGIGLNMGYETTKTMILVFVFIILEWLNRNKKHVLEKIELTFPRWVNWSFYIGICAVIFIFGGSQQDFIYFQF